MKDMTTDDAYLDVLRALGLDVGKIVSGVNEVYDEAETTIKDRIDGMKAGSVWSDAESLWNGLFGGALEAFESRQTIGERWGEAKRLKGLWNASRSGTVNAPAARQELADTLGVSMEYLEANMQSNGRIAALVDARINQAVESMTLFKDMLVELGVVAVGENPSVLQLVDGFEAIAEEAGLSADAVRLFVDAFAGVSFMGGSALVGNGTEYTGPQSDGSEFKNNIEAAQAYIDKMSVLREAILGIYQTGSATTEMMNKLASAFTDEEGWLDNILAQATEDGVLDLEAFRAALSSKLYELSQDDEGRSLLALFGIDPDNIEGMTETVGEQVDKIWQDAMDSISSAETPAALKEAWGTIPEFIQKEIAEICPEIIDMMNTVEEESENIEDVVRGTMKRISDELEIERLQKAGEAWKDLSDLMKDFAAGGSDAKDALMDMVSRTNEAATAMGALEAAQAGDADA